MSIFNILSLAGGLALFLFGMNYMGSSLEKLGGGKFESVLEKMTNSRIKGVLLGAGVTAIIQSSSAVTVMAVGFVNSSIMSLHQVIGIIMGANIGTTITSWILSLTNIESTNIFLTLLKPSSFTPVLALIGIVMYMTGKKDKKKDIGSILLGFAILMFGMEAMSDAVAPLKDVPAFTSILTMFSNPILGVAAGALLTAVIQSSSASVGILQALAVTGSISVASAFPIILGQNIGTCVTAMISSVGTSKNAKRTAVVHLAFNTIGVIIAMILFYGINAVVGLPFIKDTVNAASIAVIHTIFNVFSTIILFPFGKQLERLAKIIIPDKNEDSTNALIDERFLMTPSYAIEKVKEKSDGMGLLARDNINLCLDLIKKYSHNNDEAISKNEKTLDLLEDELETYLVKISSMNLSIEDSIKLSKLSHSISNFERIGDYGVNILKIKRRMHQSKVHFTPDANRELEVMSRAVQEITEKAVRAFIDDDVNTAAEIEPLEQVINNLKEELRARHSKRLQDDECTIENGMLFFDIINSFERIADHCSNLAVCIIELSNRSYQTHSYLKEIKSHTNKGFMEMFEDYLLKYRIG
ncbi:MAG: Na/Pi cotransporter family protein [Eubacterium sp.]